MRNTKIGESPKSDLVVLIDDLLERLNLAVKDGHEACSLPLQCVPVCTRGSGV
jgi:hypothetical protein